MSGSFKVLYVILARGGSKGLARKNLKQINGISLIGYKALSAKASRHCSRLIISSDDRDLQNEGQKYGAEVLFTRPEELASDTATSDDALLHAMESVRRIDKQTFDAVMMLEPTSPFATHLDYDAAIRVMVKNSAYLVTGVTSVDHPVEWQGRLDAENKITEITANLAKSKLTRRQACEPTVQLNGAFYLLDYNRFSSCGQRYIFENESYGLLMDKSRSINIDTQLDLEFALFLADRKIVDLSYWQELVANGS